MREQAWKRKRKGKKKKRREEKGTTPEQLLHWYTMFYLLDTCSIIHRLYITEYSIIFYMLVWLCSYDWLCKECTVYKQQLTSSPLYKCLMGGSKSKSAGECLNSGLATKPTPAQTRWCHVYWSLCDIHYSTEHPEMCGTRKEDDDEMIQNITGLPLIETKKSL